MEAARLAEQMRENCVAQNKSFTFETVLSTGRNLKLLKKGACPHYRTSESL